MARFVLIDETKFLEQSFWLEICNKLTEVAGELDGLEHLVDRFLGQYLPAYLRARASGDAERVWLAFWHYLVAPSTSRKPFGLSSQAADLLIAEFQRALSEPDPAGGGQEPVGP